MEPASLHYAEVLGDLGLQVEVLRPLPDTAVVVARLKGAGGGPTVEFNGHLDTVPVPHAAPRIEGDTRYGRSALDMKRSFVSNCLEGSWGALPVVYGGMGH